MTRGADHRHARRAGQGPGRLLGALAVLWLALPGPAFARAAGGQSLDGIVQLKSIIPEDARTAGALGTEREGSGVVIDDGGLVLTIGYLILEANAVTIEGVGPAPIPADVVAYDQQSGFGLVRARQPLEVQPIALGSSATLRPMQPLLMVSRAGGVSAAGVYLVDRRAFAGYWEYLLEDAIFTAPPQTEYGGAALLDADGRLVGVGSLYVNDAGYQNGPVPGNLFVPIDELKPILGDLLASGRRSGPPRPWLGLFLEQYRGHVFVTEVTPGGPAAAAGIRADDLILGIAGQPIADLADLYRRLWNLGAAGVEVPLALARGVETRTVAIRSGDRDRYLKLNSTY